MAEKKRPTAVFMMSPAEHRHAAFLLRQHPENPRAEYLAKHHEALAKHIQNRLDEGTARIMGD